MFAEFPLGPCKGVIRKIFGATWVVVSDPLKVEFCTVDCEGKNYLLECSFEKKALCVIF
jgi:hypothetical protein